MVRMALAPPCLNPSNDEETCKQRRHDLTEIGSKSGVRAKEPGIA
jgi:hypothetical protein